MGFKSSGTGTIFLLFMWIEPDLTEPSSLPRPPHTAHLIIMLMVIKAIKAGHFPGKVGFVRSSTDDTVTTTALIEVK